MTGDLVNIFIDFLKERKQRVVLNGDHSKWSNISAGVPQGSIVRTFLFLIFINNLSYYLISNPKLFSDDTLFFSFIHGINQSGINLNNDLKKLSSLACQWKMSFNPKQAQEGIFSCKLHKSNYPSLTFNSISVTQSEIQKHSGMFLDSKLDFKKHF